jgi:hypothetical protein
MPRLPAKLSLSIAFLFFALVAVAQTNNWTQNASGFWDVPSNWLLGLPASTHDITIGYDPYAFTGITTTHRSGTTSIRSLSTLDRFVLSGGSLTIGSGFSSISGPFDFQGGTLTLSPNVGIGGVVTWSGGTLAGSTPMNVSAGCTISGDIAITGTAAVANQGTLTWSGGNVSLASGAALKSPFPGTVFRIRSDNSITGGTFVNAGNADKNTTAGTTQFACKITNSGTLETLQGIISFLAPATFANTGTIRANGATARLLFDGGTYAVSALGTMSAINGGQILWKSTLTGGSFNPATYGAGTTFYLDGGTLKGISLTNFPQLGFVPGTTNTFDGVTTDTGITLAPPGPLVIKGLSVGGPSTIGATANILMDASTAGAGIGGDGFVASLTNDGSILCSGPNASAFTFMYPGNTVRNNGTITRDGGALVFNGGPSSGFENAGTLTAQNGSTISILTNSPNNRQNWTNTGHMIADGPTCEFDLGGTVRLSTLGDFQLLNGAHAAINAGLLENTSQVWDLSTYGGAGVWKLLDATVHGGQILHSDLLTIGPGHLSNGVTFDTVQCSGGLNMFGDVNLVTAFEAGGRSQSPWAAA